MPVRRLTPWIAGGLALAAVTVPMGLVRGDAPAASGAHAAATSVRVGLDEWRVSPSPRRARSRRVRFRVRNRGSERHNFVVIRTRRRASRLPVRGSRASERGRVGKIGRFSPGRTRRLSLRLRRGHYALICNVPGHYSAGMRADFRVR